MFPKTRMLGEHNAYVLEVCHISFHTQYMMCMKAYV